MSQLGLNILKIKQYSIHLYILIAMSIHYRGLSAEQVAENRQKFGANVITFTISPRLAQKLTTLNASWQVKLLFFVSFLLLLLLTFMEVIGIDITLDIWFIYLEFIAMFMFVYFLMVILTCAQYWLKLRETRLQQQISNQKGLYPFRVIRNGILVMIPRREIVVHDVIILQSGDEIPADGYLLDSCDLVVNESLFSGNAYCIKSTDHADYDLSAMFSTNKLVGGSWVLDGEGIMEVTAVGDRTVYAGMIRKRMDDSTSGFCFSKWRQVRLERIYKKRLLFQ